MTRPPRDPVKDKMTNDRLVSFCYGQISLIEAAGGFFAYYVVYAENGFWPSRILGARKFWDSTEINDFRDSYGAEWTYDQRQELERAGQTAFYVGIVVCQIANALVCKTKRISIFKHGIRNMQMNAAFVGTVAVAAFLQYTPGLNDGLNLYPLRFLWWLPAIPFSIVVFGYGEIIKLLARRSPDGFFDKQIII